MPVFGSDARPNMELKGHNEDDFAGSVSCLGAQPSWHRSWPRMSLGAMRATVRIVALRQM
jgi:hypothetical protein